MYGCVYLLVIDHYLHLILKGKTIKKVCICIFAIATEKGLWLQVPKKSMIHDC